MKEHSSLWGCLAGPSPHGSAVRVLRLANEPVPVLTAPSAFQRLVPRLSPHGSGKETSSLPSLEEESPQMFFQSRGQGTYE